MDTENQRQHRRNNVRLTESRNTSSEQLQVMPTESLNQQRMAARRALEWIRMSKLWLVIRLVLSLVQSCPILEVGMSLSNLKLEA